MSRPSRPESQYKERFSLNYDIRHESNSFLKKEGLLFDCEDNQDEEYQDITAVR